MQMLQVDGGPTGCGSVVRRRSRGQIFMSRSTSPDPGGPADSVSVCLGARSTRSGSYPASGLPAGLSADTGSVARLDGYLIDPSDQKGVVVLMSYLSWSATPGRPLPFGGDAVHCRGGIRRWSG